MWPDLPKGVLYMHSFKSHFSQPFDRYNNRLTVHACIIAKASTVYFYWGLIHGPVWHPRMLRWSVNGSNLPSQADSRQGVTTGLAGETGHWCSYVHFVMCGTENSLNWSQLAINFFVSEGPTTSWLHTTPHPPPL